MSLHLEQGFSASAPRHSGRIVLCCGSCSVHCGTFSSIPGLHSRGAGSPRPLGCDHQHPQTCQICPRGKSHPPPPFAMGALSRSCCPLGARAFYFVTQVAHVSGRWERGVRFQDRCSCPRISRSGPLPTVEIPSHKWVSVCPGRCAHTHTEEFALFSETAHLDVPA